MNDKIQYAKSRVRADLWKEARAAAIREGVSMRAWLEQAIGNHLKNDRTSEKGE